MEKQLKKDRKYIKLLLELFREIKFKKIIFMGYTFKNTVDVIDFFSQTKASFYICNRGKCLKCENKEKFFNLGGVKVYKRKLKDMFDDDLLQDIFFADFKDEGKAQKNSNVKFDKKLFKQFLKDNLGLLENDFYIEEYGNVINVKILFNLKMERVFEIAEYLREWDKFLKNIGVDKNIKLLTGMCF